MSNPFLAERFVSVPDHLCFTRELLHLPVEFAPPNSTQKPTRPGFGPAAEPPRSAQLARRHAACIARLPCRQAARRCGFGTWALAAQLSACPLG